MITLSSRLDEPNLAKIIGEMNAYLSMVERKLWADVMASGKKPGSFKREYLCRYEISGRHFNSIASSIDGKTLALKKLRAREISELKVRIGQLGRGLQKKTARLKAARRSLVAIARYRGRVAKWRRARKGKKPGMPRSLVGKHIEQLREVCDRLPGELHQKRRRLYRLEHRLSRLERQSLRLCYGTRKLFRRQWHLQENGYSSHDEWKADWRAARDAESFWIGSSDETLGNQNAQYDLISGRLQLRLPNALAKTHGKYLVVENLYFGTKHDATGEQGQSSRLLAAAAQAEQKARAQIETEGKTRIKGLARSLRLKVLKNGTVQVFLSFEEVVPKASSNLTAGVIGLDLNADHIAMCATNIDGNPVEHDSYPVPMVGKTTDQLTAILGDHIALIVEQAARDGRAIAIEDLDFSAKKAALSKERGPRYARMLSSFAYAKFREMLASKCRALGVRLQTVNPAFTSVIGFAKFSGYKRLSSHEMAALAIARRSMGFSERPKRHVARCSTASMSMTPYQTLLSERKEAAKGSPRHVWSYWSVHAKPVRAAMRKHKASETPPPADLRRPSGVLAGMDGKGKGAARAARVAALKRYQRQGPDTPRRAGCWPSEPRGYVQVSSPG